MSDGRVDVHAHLVTDDYRAALEMAGLTMPGGIPIPPWKPELALQFMDAHDIERQILSVSDPGVNFLPAVEAASMARSCNEAMAATIAAHPDRFGGFAVLPTWDVDAALAELDYGLDHLGLAGAGLLSSSAGRYLGDTAFEPLLVELDRRGAWAFVHPTSVAAIDKPSTGLPDFLTEFPFDTTRTIVSLLTNNCFERFPEIRWHFAHGGGTIPMLSARLDIASVHAKLMTPVLGLPDHAADLRPESAREGLAGSFYDTALIASRPSLAALAAITPTDHILFGSDWPFAGLAYPPEGDPQPALTEVFGAEIRSAIDHDNAKAQGL
jgi:predicted TIM-barrel fold metal-dependent hydrolase